jgi:hypothetical protein
MNFVFDGLGIFEEAGKSHETYIEKHQEATRIRGMQSIYRMELPKTM